MFTEIPLEATYVVKIHNAAIMSEIQPVFSFYHPDIRNGDFECSKVMEFTATMTGIIHGFSGYFESNVTL